jgi:hypothetical protein
VSVHQSVCAPCDLVAGMAVLAAVSFVAPFLIGMYGSSPWLSAACCLLALPSPLSTRPVRPHLPGTLIFNCLVGVVCPGVRYGAVAGTVYVAAKAAGAQAYTPACHQALRRAIPPALMLCRLKIENAQRGRIRNQPQQYQQYYQGLSYAV